MTRCLRGRFPTAAMMQRRGYRVVRLDSAATEFVGDVAPHLHDRAPYRECDRCGRRTWSLGEDACTATEPDGVPCGGRYGRLVIP